MMNPKADPERRPPGTLWEILAKAMRTEAEWSPDVHGWAFALAQQLWLWPLRIAMHGKRLRTQPYQRTPRRGEHRVWVNIPVPESTWLMLQAWQPSRGTPVDPLEAVAAWLQSRIEWVPQPRPLHDHFQRTRTVALPLVGPRGLQPQLTPGLREAAFRYLSRGAKYALWYQLESRGPNLPRERWLRTRLESVDAGSVGLDVPHHLCAEFRKYAVLARQLYNQRSTPAL